MRIGVDLLGSESSPEVLFKAVLQVAEQMGDSDTLVVYVTHSEMEQLLRLGRGDLDVEKGVDLHPVGEFIAMDDEPLSSVRLKRDSSLVVGIQQLSEGKTDAFVSAGNTGALIASSTIMLPKLSGVERPALLAVLPTQNSPSVMVDVGGVISCKAETLVQYARMGAVFQRRTLGIERPTVGLLNIGEESKKGKAEVREAYDLLQQEAEASEANIRFLGNIEGREVFQGKVDVIVTDGFTGNVVLKTSEGISSFIFDYLQEAIKEKSSIEFHQTLGEIQRHFSYDEYPGAVVCGVKGIVVKCHGAATEKGFMHSIKGAMRLVESVGSGIGLT